MGVEKFTPDTTIDEVMADPHRFGAPTYQEFVRNRDKYLGKPDENLAIVDQGGQIINRYVRKMLYEINGYRCKTLVEVERIARDHGIPPESLRIRPEVLPDVEGKCDLLIRFRGEPDCPMEGTKNAGMDPVRKDMEEGQGGC